MKKILKLLWLNVCCFFVLNSYAAGIGTISSVSVNVTDRNGNTSTTPYSAFNLSTANNLSKIAFTFNGISGLVFADNSASPIYSANWGIYFGSSTSGIYCSGTTCTGGSGPMSSVTFTIDSNVPSVSSSPLTASGSLTVTLDFTNATNNYQLPGDLSALINNPTLTSASLTVGPLYNAGNSNGGITYGSTTTWPAIPDSGTLMSGPVLQASNVTADVNSFHVTGAPPTSLSAVCPAASGTCVSSGELGTTLITTALPNVVSGYVVGFWKDSDCKAGGFNFSPNWMAYNYVANISYTCTYSSYRTSFNTGGTSSILGCDFSTQPVTFYTGAISPTAETAAIPYITSNPKQDLQNMINKPGSIYKSANSCISYVYLSTSGSSSTFTTPRINNGDVYGLVVWALNSASDSTYSIPNYSLNHSNIFYTTGVNFQLASTTKNGSLTRSKDCFIVTAASGNIDSKSVYYWRILRDTYLTPLGITRIYYKHAQSWAFWLDEHPSLKPPLNFIFEKTGYVFYNVTEFVSEIPNNYKNKFHKFINFFSSIFDNTANAEELNQTHYVAHKLLAIEQNAIKNKKNFGFEQDSEEQNIDIVPDDIKNDPFFSGDVKQRIAPPPPYEVAFTGGILLPTQDKIYYDCCYNTQPTLHGELEVSRLFWRNNIGYSIGLQGRYLTNRQEHNSVPVLGGSSQLYTRTFYAISAEALLGMRYRNPNFSYLQPGIFAGGGVTRFREDVTPEGNTSSSSGATGVTEYSPIYEAGASLDISLSKITGDADKNADDIINEILLRFSGSYNVNQSKALSSTGIFVQAGFAFLLN